MSAYRVAVGLAITFGAAAVVLGGTGYVSGELLRLIGGVLSEYGRGQAEILMRTAWKTRPEDWERFDAMVLEALVLALLNTRFRHKVGVVTSALVITVAATTPSTRSTSPDRITRSSTAPGAPTAAWLLMVVAAPLMVSAVIA